MFNMVKFLSTFRNNGRQKLNVTTAANKICKQLLSRNHNQKVKYYTTYMHSPPPCNIVNLLSTDKRDFLIRNNGQPVSIDTLSGKFVAIFHKLYPLHRNDPVPLSLLEAYKTLYPRGDFKVVFVALTQNDDDDDADQDSYEWFNNYFLNMPWLAVPFSDFGTRKRVLDLLSPYIPLDNGDCIILDKLGNVAHPVSLSLFDVYGADWYPFTHERCNELDMEGYRPFEDFSLKDLLCSPSRDYVITKNRNKVLIDKLESKVVGLYFYDLRKHDWPDCRAIRSAYDELKAKGVDFEIVFINRYVHGGYRDEESFNKCLDTMPWLALPFGDKTCEKLAKKFSIEYYTASYSSTVLVMIKPGVFCEIYGVNVFQEYGIEAYPFTMEKAAEIEIEKRSLFSLLEAEGQEFVIQNDNDKTKIKVSELKGKRICMVLVFPQVSFKSLHQVINWHNKVKRVDDEFETIYVSGCKNVTEFDYMSAQMPSTWLALPFGAGDKISSMMNLWGCLSIMVAFFKPDGKFLTRNHLWGEDEWELLSNSNYPFNVDIDTVEDMRLDIQDHNLWY